MIYYLIIPILLFLCMAQKSPGLAKYIFQRGNIPYQKEISVKAGEILLEITHWNIWLTLQCSLLFSLIIYLPIQSITCWFHLFWSLYTEKNNVKWGRKKGDRQKFRDFKHKLKHKIRCYTKYFLVFTAYQLQGWWTMILSPVKYQQNGSNVE